ncbi:MAG: sporulation protein, partial [Lentisphaerae bacterium]
RTLCCSSFLAGHFVSINVRMAKIQNVSLSPVAIIGACGRLKCCLNYEVEGYRQLLSCLPRIGTRCRCDNEVGRVVDRNQLLQTVTVELPDSRLINKHISEIRILDR